MPRSITHLTLIYGKNVETAVLLLNEMEMNLS